MIYQKSKKITAEPNVGRQEADQSEMKKESPISKSWIRLVHGRPLNI